LLPIDESEELQELLQSTTTKDLGSGINEEEEKETTLSSTSSSLIVSEITDSGKSDTTYCQSSTSSSLSSSRFSTTLMKAKRWIKRGKL